MNRGQVKRIRKETERLRKAGREWDALGMLTKEGAAEEFRTEWDDIWRELARHALRNSARLEEFLVKIDEFEAVPDTGDVRFLRCVGDYLDAKEVAPALKGMTGLSAPAEILRRELLRRGCEPQELDLKLPKLLERFAFQPEKTLQKDYRQLKELLAPYPAISQHTCETLEESLTLARRQNSASAVKNGQGGVSETDLRRIDVFLKKVSTGVPGPLFRVVAAPVFAQVSAAVRRIAKDNPDRGALLALSAPFCMENLLGPGWENLRKKFQLESAHTLTAQDHSDLHNTAQKATFEERLSLIGKLTRLISCERNFDEDLQDTLILLYKGVFAELAKRRPTLPEREQRRVAAVFGPFLAKHLGFLCGSQGDLPFILDIAAAAGCLDAQSALLHVFFAGISRDRGMIANARRMLKIIPEIKEQDVLRLFDTHQIMLVEDVKGLKGMLDICRESGHELEPMLAKSLGLSVISLLAMNTLAGSSGRNSLLDKLLGSFQSEEPMRAFRKLSKGVDCFADNSAFDYSIQLVKGFPSGRFSGGEYRLFLENQLVRGISVLQAIGDTFAAIEMILKMNETKDGIFPFGKAPLVEEILVATLEVLCGKKERLVLIPTKDLVFLIKTLFQCCDGRGLDRYLMLIANVGAERSQAGDHEAGKLHKSVMDAIARNIIPKRGRRR